jgi:apolipoprotein N-acyltransferase
VRQRPSRVRNKEPPDDDSPSYILKNTRPASLFYALCSGLLLILSFPGAVGWWPCVWLALVPFFAAVRNVSMGRAFRLGLLAGFVHYTFLLYWIVIVLGTYGYLAWWITIPALLLLSLYMSLYPAIFAVIISRVMQKGGNLLWLAPVLWVSLDAVRGKLFTGFPWQDLAYSQYQVPALIQAADLVGHHGITFLIVLANGLLYTVATRFGFLGTGKVIADATLRSRRLSAGPVVAGLVILAAVIYGPLRYGQVAEQAARCPTVRVAVIQGNIAQDRKWTPAMQHETLEIYQRLSTKAVEAADSPGESTLLIWPETALPFYIRSEVGVPAAVAQLPRDNGSCLLTGVPYAEGAAGRNPAEDHYYNSAILLGPDGGLNGRYDKQHLVPFGEFIPFRKYLPFVSPLVESMGDFTPGSLQQPLACQTAGIGVLICFESIFPDLSRKWTENGANLLVNITNDAWFGRSSAPWQHFSMAVFRAIETRRSLARAAKNFFYPLWILFPRFLYNRGNIICFEFVENRSHQKISRRSPEPVLPA